MKNDALIDLSGRLDPMFVRAHLHKIGRKGWSLTEAQCFAKIPQFMALMNEDCGVVLRDNFSKSRSQLLQDLFVMLATRNKRDGFFVEIGVGDGENLSNTYLMEKQFGWSGILAEPNIRFHDSIAAKRSAILDRRAVFSQSGLTLDLLMDSNVGELSTLVDFDGRDSHVREGTNVPVETVTLDDLLTQHNAPETIDYMSIDTEGSEYEIVRSLDLTKWKVMVFSIESNFDIEKTKKIEAILLPNGYKPAAQSFSQFDSWYLHPELSAFAEQLAAK